MLPIVDDAARKPAWIAARAPGAGAFGDVREVVGDLVTVCEEARCPNQGACWGEGTATFLLMGRTCTRGCRFCHVASGKHGDALDASEPERVAAASRALGLSHCVLTSVDRDDLADQGAAHLAACVTAVKRTGATVELLMPDLSGRADLLDVVLDARPDVLAHNIETVERLTPSVRDRRASYEASVVLLARAKDRAAASRVRMATKSGLMLGLGETHDEVLEAIDDLVEAGVDVLTLGQYLRPSAKHARVERYVRPDEFAALADEARRRGIRAVASGPLVRSSYRAAALLAEIR